MIVGVLETEDELVVVVVGVNSIDLPISGVSRAGRMSKDFESMVIESTSPSTALSVVDVLRRRRRRRRRRP